MKKKIIIDDNQTLEIICKILLTLDDKKITNAQAIKAIRKIALINATRALEDLMKRGKK